MYVSPKVSTNRGAHVGPSPSQVGSEGGRLAPLWHQISSTLAGTHARRLQRYYRHHKVCLAKKYGHRRTVFCHGNVVAMFGNCLCDAINTLYALHWNTHAIQ
jgi:hypothetical protein